MQTEAVSPDSARNGSATTKDPVLLGVSLPVSATVAAASQLKDVWASALTALLAAAKEKASAAKAKATENTDIKA